MAEGPLHADELVDRCFSRPVARAIVAAVRPTPVTPNMLTAVAAGFGIAAGVCLALQAGVWAAGMLAGYLAFDCSDGQLARTRGGGDVMGRVVDGFGDYVTAVAVHVGLLLWIADGHGFVVAVPPAVGAGFSMSWTALLLDRYKRRYEGTVDDLAAIDAVFVRAPWHRRLMLRTFRSYAGRVDGGVRIPDLEAYRRRVRAPMRLWLWVGPTTHYAALGVCAVLAAPLEYAFVACLPFNLLALVALILQRRLERRPPAVVADRGAGQGVVDAVETSR